MDHNPLNDKKSHLPVRRIGLLIIAVAIGIALVFILTLAGKKRKDHWMIC